MLIAEYYIFTYGAKTYSRQADDVIILRNPVKR